MGVETLRFGSVKAAAQRLAVISPPMDAASNWSSDPLAARDIRRDIPAAHRKKLYGIVTTPVIFFRKVGDD